MKCRTIQCNFCNCHYMVLSDDSVWLFVSSRYQRYRKNQELPVGLSHQLASWYFRWHGSHIDLAFCPESYYFIYFVIYNILIFVRIGFVRAQLGYSLRRFIFKDYLPVVSCCLISVIPAWAITKNDGWRRYTFNCNYVDLLCYNFDYSIHNRYEQRWTKIHYYEYKNRLSLS